MKTKTNMEFLEWMTECITEQRVDIAFDHRDYLLLTYAIANDCGEAGRALFHRITSISTKYDCENNDKLYTQTLRTGRNGNTLGTVYYLAVQAGVKFERNEKYHLYKNFISEISCTPSSYTHTRACAVPPGETLGFIPQEAEDVEVVEEKHPEVFPTYQWPNFLQRCVACGGSDPQRDILWLSCLAVLGATIAPTLHFFYSRRKFHPNLQLFVVAEAASGKGVMSWAYRLGAPMHRRFRREYEQARAIYKKQLAAYQQLGKKKSEMEEPVQPPVHLFYISGNNTGTGLLENLFDAKGMGILFLYEADEISTSIASQYGHFSDVLRKVFDHEKLSFNRRTDREYREVERTWLTVVMSGTPGQVEPYVNSAENGLFSRILFYKAPPVTKWKNQFVAQGEDLGDRFEAWGNRWEEVMELIRKEVSSVEMVLTDEQQERFNRTFAAIFTLANSAHQSVGRSSVARMAINLLRMMELVAWLRALDEWLMGDEPVVSASKRLLRCPGIEAAPETHPENVRDGVVANFRLHISEEDFEAMLRLVEVFYHHSSYIMTLLPDSEGTSRERSPKELFLDSLPILFNRQQAVALAKECKLNENTMDSHLRRMLKTGELLRDGDNYRFLMSFGE